jgi:hypothetical protein
MLQHRTGLTMNGSRGQFGTMWRLRSSTSCWYEPYDTGMLQRNNMQKSSGGKSYVRSGGRHCGRMQAESLLVQPILILYYGTTVPRSTPQGCCGTTATGVNTSQELPCCCTKALSREWQTITADAAWSTGTKQGTTAADNHLPDNTYVLQCTHCRAALSITYIAMYTLQCRTVNCPHMPPYKHC